MEQYEDEDSLSAILQELKNAEPVEETSRDLVNNEEVPKVTNDNLGDFILQQEANMAVATQKIASTLLSAIRSAPEQPELIDAVSQMLNAHNKSIETLTKIHLSREKLEQMKNLEEFKQRVKLQIADKKSKPEMTRDELLKLITDKTASTENIIVTKRPED